MNLNEECLLKYLQNPDELIDLTTLLVEFNNFTLSTEPKILLNQCNMQVQS